MTTICCILSVTVALVGLKLAGVLSLGWAAVLSPLWLTLTVLGLWFMALLVVLAYVEFFIANKEK